MSARKKSATGRPANNTGASTPEPTADASVLRTDAEKALWTALCNHPGFTAAELADAAGIGGSTARRILSGWATTGAAHRDRHADNPRTAERWSPATETPATTAASTEPSQSTESTEPAGDLEPVQPASGIDTHESGSDDASSATESDDTVADAAPATGHQAAPQPPADTETTAPVTYTPAADPDVAAAPQKSPDRLAPGALRGEVEDHLRDAPEKEFTPHEIGKSLGRSSGAVHNALVKLTALGTARQTCTRPKKFALATGQ
ncbi:hypothetical protein NOVA_27290 [Nocardia nova]|uniref:hypothetical protein n=1 Tax=Nocardia nova TaxID=37330 RepID=UPI001C449860|nr:hypothetical protein [Nocardia nova]MBV7706496.1 hypothetical protein [Nocardia nova]